MSTTPISAIPSRNCASLSVGLTGAQPNLPQMAGPIKSPAMTAPTTCGKPNLRISIPNNLVASNMTAKSQKIVKFINSPSYTIVQNDTTFSKKSQ